MDVVRIFVGSIFVLFGFLGIAVGILGIIDPVGLKMADDSDPFGSPPSMFENLAYTAIFVTIFIFGVWLVAAKQKESN
ncbi:MAG: hypothetical protein H7070_05995 [Saprospiraceae bacterium]|nr:hypothetical protein [Pyrinomonadaceae bacterium]